MIKTTLLAVSIAPALFLAPTHASLQSAQSYFPSLNDAEKEVYSQWLSSSFSSYGQNAFLPSTEDPDNGSAVFWAIEGEDINFAVAVRATGWLGFGISEAGGMLGADVVTFQVPSSDGAKKLVDSYILEDRAAPLEDDCQDWILKSATTEGGWIIIEMSRKLDTGDQQDHEIRNDADLWNAPTHLISAWGDAENVVYHGSSRARLSVRLHADVDALSLKDQLIAKSDGYFDFREDNFVVPTNETTYQYYCKTFDEFKLDPNFPQDQSLVTMIGVHPVLTEETAPLVHHFLVFSTKNCDPDNVSRGIMVYVWAPGDEGLMLPDDVGLSLLDSDKNQGLLIEIHYNNPSGVEGKKDSSGVRFYFTQQERTHKAGVLQLGDPFVQLWGEKINDGLTQYQFTCPGQCSSTFLGNKKVTVFSESLHMHETGARMTNEVLRNDKVVHEGHVDVFEFDQQGSFRVQQEPFDILPGDLIRTTCYYRDAIKFGLGSDEEMCIAYLFYYPAIQQDGFEWMCPHGVFYPVCDGELSSADLSDDKELGRFFGSSNGVCVRVIESPEVPTDLSDNDPKINENPTVADKSASDNGFVDRNGVNTRVFVTITNLFLMFNI